jgi:hypothetical protein
MPEKKAYYTLEETARLLGKNRATIYNRMNMIQMKGHKFKGDRRTYLSAAEVEKLRRVLEQPWLAGEKEEPGEPEGQEVA